MMQRQIAKAQKYCPDGKLSKLIDLSDFRAQQKTSQDNKINSIAINFKKQRE